MAAKQKCTVTLPKEPLWGAAGPLYQLIEGTAALDVRNQVEQRLNQLTALFRLFERFGIDDSLDGTILEPIGGLCLSITEELQYLSRAHWGEAPESIEATANDPRI